VVEDRHIDIQSLLAFIRRLLDGAYCHGIISRRRLRAVGRRFTDLCDLGAVIGFSDEGI
jgi:hypothetical protein